MATAVITPRYEQAEVIQTIKQTVAKGATDAQLRMFIEVCKRTGLDPFLKEIWFVPEKGIIMAGRDGYLRAANEDPNFDGIETHVERDANNVPVKATCTVWRKDRNHPTVCEAWYSEYAKQSPVWKQYPSAMISKVAEVLALKRSFSINGVVTEEEIGFERAPRAGYGDSGSAEAAQQVAERKIRQLRAPQTAVAAVESLPEHEYEEPPAEEESELEQQLRESIEFAEQLKPRKNPPKFALLRAFGEIKKRYQAIGYERTYYGYLAQYGVQHSNQFPDTEDGLTEARHCYKRMSLDVAEREAKIGGAR